MCHLTHLTLLGYHPFRFPGMKKEDLRSHLNWLDCVFEVCVAMKMAQNRKG